ncbi:MAG: hypothetical protein LBH29_06070 [Elusimicrobiota bacterium]|jgi:hypothetical protein|nr:hypothetical protein [Elusimicrobiota bacterium]
MVRLFEFLIAVVFITLSVETSKVFDEWSDRIAHQHKYISKCKKCGKIKIVKT